ncbi:MAG: Fic family protein [Desulfosalsimonas sp.]
MKESKPDNKPAGKPVKNTLSLRPYLPGSAFIGPLKDLAQQTASASAALEGRLARETADALGWHLRLINSYYSNLIEGHKTTIPDIEMALQRHFRDDPEKKYAQQLCAAHVETEKAFMAEVQAQSPPNICTPEFLSKLHAAFYERLPAEHRFAHTPEGFSDIPVNPGQLRDVNVSVDGRSPHGPGFSHLPGLMKIFAEKYNPNRFHGDERLIAMAASHHRLTWLHPFRDGNGRVARLFSGLYLARSGVNQSNLWSLSRGLSRQKQRYMMELWAADSPEPKQKDPGRFSEEMLADFCRFFLLTCLDQIGFMEKLLRLDQIEARIDWYVDMRTRDARHPLRPESSRLLRAAFMRGRILRGRAGEILNMSQRNARRIVAALLDEGLLVSASHRAPLVMGLPLHVLPYYFPDLYNASNF